jgi:uncharacterized protein (DUF885 family)
MSQFHQLHRLFDNYYEERLALFPVEATLNGDHRYDGCLANEISEEHRNRQEDLANKYLRELAAIDRDGLSEADQLGWDVLRSDLTRIKEGLKFPEHLLPIGRMDDLPTTFARLGSGTDIQPFKTVEDYESFLGRIHGFTAWVDMAIANMRRGMACGVVQAHNIAVKSIAQFEGLLVPDARESVFHQPIRNMPSDFSDTIKARLTETYTKAIANEILPAYHRLTAFLRREYLPRCRPTVGWSALPDGRAWYERCVRYYTTTDLTPERIFELGTSEVARITGEMETLRDREGFSGDLTAFSRYLERTIPTFRTKSDLIRAYSELRARIEPRLSSLFSRVPTAAFEIRPVEEFCETTSSTQMAPAAGDGSRPAVFYVNGAGIETTPMSISESTFLHEAVPGHHLQSALAFEQRDLPKFRQFAVFDAYAEGWALYAESLGAELGCYRDAGQRLKALADEMLRARRLVVDTGLHAMGWTRDQALEYMLQTPGFPAAEAELEVDRYIGWPGQALSYKCGQLAISALRAKAENALPERFDVRSFHDELLRDGCLPLDILEAKMDRWIAAQLKQPRPA